MLLLVWLLPLITTNSNAVRTLHGLLKDKRDVLIASQMSSADVLTKYGTQPQIYSWLEDIAQQCGDRCSLMPFGTSVEGKQMKIIKIMGEVSTENKSAVFIDGGAHGREWIAPAFVNNLIHKFVTNYNTDSDIREILEVYDLYIIPLLNPDGYQYSHTHDRMWRKNRAETTNATCKGVDINRNFGFQFGRRGSSSDPCSETYRGPSAFSEPESQAMRDFISGLDLKVYFSFHSYGQLILYPYSYERIYTSNRVDLDEVGRVGAAAIQGANWTVGNSARILHPASGSSSDWVFSFARAPYSYGFELPPNNMDVGFLLPESQIAEVVSSVWPGVKAMILRIIEKGNSSLPLPTTTPTRKTTREPTEEPIESTTATATSPIPTSPSTTRPSTIRSSTTSPTTTSPSTTRPTMASPSTTRPTMNSPSTTRPTTTSLNTTGVSTTILTSSKTSLTQFDWLLLVCVTLQTCVFSMT